MLYLDRSVPATSRQCRGKQMSANSNLNYFTAWGQTVGQQRNFLRDEHGAVKKRGSLTLSSAEKGAAYSPVATESEDRRANLCDSGLPDGDVCNVLLTPSVKKDILEEAWARGKWLLGLLVAQSMSSVILEHYQQLIKDHLVVTLFLSTLIGSGGNAGNQSAIKVIRGLATKSISLTGESMQQTLIQQGAIGLLLGLGLAGGGFVRVYLTNGSLVNSSAISISLFAIVMTSVLTGTALPFGLAKLGVDPANAGTSIQVIMDILGVGITCVTCHTILDVLAKGLS